MADSSTPIEASFKSLAECPFANSREGNLATIHTPGINLVLGTRTFSPQAVARLKEVDVTRLAKAHGKQLPNSFKLLSIGGAEGVVGATLLESVGAILEVILPPHKGNRAIAQDLALMLGDVSVAYANEPLDWHFAACLNGSRGFLHHDNYTEHRWLITLPTSDKVSGTWLADDFVRSNPILPFGDPLAGSVKGFAHNNYGRPSAEWSHLLREAPIGRIVGWHGDETGMPRIHCEPDVASDEAARLTLVATPMAMNRRESVRRLQANPSYS